ncbi:hypothetical protein CPB86DRAFT_208340 [Serendipita vermifera]|nr:hypothetical protein CPB86DRAFT_208340 [Serendipita vermifera]
MLRDSRNFLHIPSRVEQIPFPLVVIHIPRTSFLGLIHPVISQLLQPTSCFFSIAFNETEVTLVFEESARRIFQSFIAHDGHASPAMKQTLQGNSSSSDSGGVPLNEATHLSPKAAPSDRIQISPSQWAGLSLDIAGSTTRLSSLLVAFSVSDIPILHQSAMNCEYLFMPSSHLDRALLILEDSGFLFSEDEYNGSRRSRSHNRSRPLVRRWLDGAYHAVNPLSEDQSSTQNTSLYQEQDSSRPSHRAFPPVRLLPHGVVFHGLNGRSGDAFGIYNADWLLKIVKMIGWPETLLPSSSKIASRQSDMISVSSSPVLATIASNAPPSRPKLIHRHSDDASTKSKVLESRTRTSPTSTSHSHPIAQSRRNNRYRSTSYLEELDSNSHATREYLNRKKWPASQNGIFDPTHAAYIESRLKNLSLIEEADNQSACGASTEVSPQTEPDLIDIEDPSVAHVATLPFFALTFRSYASVGNIHTDEFKREAEISIMTRGRLLAQIFDSSMLIGGEGEIAISDEDDLGHDDYDRGKSRDSHRTSSSHSKNAVDYSELDNGFPLMDEPTRMSRSYLPRDNFDSYQPEEGFRCLQFDLSNVKFVTQKSHVLCQLAEALNHHEIKYHLSTSLDSVNILVTVSNTAKALRILQAAHFNVASSA